MDTPSCTVSGSGVNLDRFAPTHLPNKASFLFAARLLNGKGVREYIDAASRIRGMHPGIEFGLAGWIDDNPDSISQDELDAWVEEGCVRFYGKLLDVRPAISKCSVFVLPSYREGVPRSVLEAMAMGRAIITTDTPGCRETVVNGENGFLIPVRSVDALEAAMQKFIDRPEIIQQMGMRSRTIAEDKFDVQKVNAVMLREMEIV
jgi:glycosyltransferase involved in cell wall biosynthesis